MKITRERIEQVAGDMDVSFEELEKFVALGEERDFAKGDYLFHESAPRQWFGIVLQGKINLQRGLAGRHVTLAILSEGAVIGESLFIDDLDHSVSGLALEEVQVWAIPREKLEVFREEKPEIFYRITARAARRIGHRLRETTELLLNAEHSRSEITDFRKEHDSLGDREVSNAHYYGVQTMRAVENFPFSGIRLSHFQHLVNGFAYVKKAAAIANSTLGVLNPKIADAICAACDRILDGHAHEHFVVDMVQGGAGTSTNMNANEVIANLAWKTWGIAKEIISIVIPTIMSIAPSQPTTPTQPQ